MNHTTKIKYSLTFITVSVRKWQGINPNDYVGYLLQGTQVSGEIFFVDNIAQDIWMLLKGGQYNGFWIALSYNGKVFVNELPVRDIIPPPPVETVPGDKLLGFVYPSYINHFYPAKGKNLPDTRAVIGASVKNNGRTLLIEAIQNVIFHDNFLRAYGCKFDDADYHIQALAVHEWVYLLGEKLVFVNDAGSNERKVPIANLNMNAKWPEANQITFPGLIELVEDKTYTILKKLNQIPFYAINGQHKHIEDFTSEKYPYRWKRPVIFKRKETNGGVEGAEPFGQFRARFRWMAPMMNGTDVAFIDKKYIKVLKPGDPIPSIFTKDWGA